MVSEQYATLIEQCIAEVEHTTSANKRTFRPPANPMRAVPGGAAAAPRRMDRRPAALDRVPYPALAQGKRSGRRKLATAVAALGLVGLAGFGLFGGSGHQATPLPSAPQTVRLSVRAPATQVALDLRAGESCHQIERDLMTTFQNPDGSFYSQSQADAIIAQSAASC